MCQGHRFDHACTQRRDQRSHFASKKKSSACSFFLVLIIDHVPSPRCQAYAVHLALHQTSSETTLVSLIDLVNEVFPEKEPNGNAASAAAQPTETEEEEEEDEDDDDEDEFPRHTTDYFQSMSLMTRALSSQSVKSGFKLGNDVIAQQSVPSAVFCALMAQNDIPGLEPNCQFTRTLQVSRN